MFGKTRFAIVLGVTLSFLNADVARADALALAIEQDKDMAQQGNAPPPPQGEIRRASPGTCAAIGAIVGGIAGMIFGNARNGGFNTGAALIGGGGAGLICGAVRWRSVHRRDQDEVNRRVAAMTVSANAGAQTYTSEATGKTYTITPGETTFRQADAEFTTIEQVDAPQMGSKLSATPYRVVTALLNLRASPGTETGRVTGAFYQGDVIESMSETADGQWVLVGYQNVGFGWVARRYLEPITEPRDRLIFAVPGMPQAAPAAPTRTAARQRRGAAAARPTNLVAAPRRITATPSTRTQTVSAQMVCRSIMVSEGRRSDRHPSCTGPRGSVLMG
jgi:hypothetical protein